MCSSDLGLLDPEIEQASRAGNIENLMVVSGIEAPAATRLFNLWVEQAFGDKTRLRLGQFTAAQEFLVSQNANLFVNSTFGWPDHGTGPSERWPCLSGGDARLAAETHPG